MKNTELCVSICKYDPNFLNGQVCIGCFREQYEIINWHKMSTKEKKVAQEDIIKRKMKYEGKK
jgi:predicted Fe-S protein YdhL (DUF1289 family)